MRTQKSWIACAVFLAALVLEGIPAASSYQQNPPEQRPPLSEEERKRILERLLHQAQRTSDAQKQPGIRPAPEGTTPAPPGAPAAPPVPSIVQRAPMANGQVQLS